MGARKKIAIFYTYQEGWIGGTYYIQNLVHALHTLPDSEKPELIVVCRTDEEFAQITATGFPYLQRWPLENCQLEGRLSIFDRAINKLARTIFGETPVHRPARLNLPDVADLVFPCPELKPFADARQCLYWIPDFQELHLPQFFDEAQLRRRQTTAAYIAANRMPVLFSSRDALHDFERAYPDQQQRAFVVPFAVTHPDLHGLDIEKLKQQYGLPDTYYFAPNQFWKHKDHLTLIRAAEQLIRETASANFQVVFSGKEDDFRNPGYSEGLKQYVADQGLEKYVRFLGFIDRREQLLILKHARAVVQPSLFEGWSTVVEDAKALQRPVIASDLRVHQEQLQAYPAASLFRAGDAMDLARVLREDLGRQPFPVAYDYARDVRAFGRSFMAVAAQLGPAT